MKSRLHLILTAATAALALGLSTSAADAPKLSIEEIMEKGFKGKMSPAARVGKGEGTKEDFKLMAELSAALAKTKPPQGDEADWKVRTAKLAAAGKLLAEGKPGALDAWKEAANCKQCHEIYRPE